MGLICVNRSTEMGLCTPTFSENMFWCLPISSRVEFHCNLPWNSFGQESEGNKTPLLKYSPRKAYFKFKTLRANGERDQCLGSAAGPCQCCWLLVCCLCRRHSLLLPIPTPLFLPPVNIDSTSYVAKYVRDSGFTDSMLFLLLLSSLCRSLWQISRLPSRDPIRSRCQTYKRISPRWWCR